MVEDLSLLTTLRLEAGRCCLLSFHLDRFEAGAVALNFAFDRRDLERALTIAAAQYNQKVAASLRVTVARNGSWTIEQPQPLAQLRRFPHWKLWPDRVRSADTLLSQSTTYRPIYEEALRCARQLGLLDFVFQNECGLVTEGADHSIFVRHGQRWRTPTLSAGVLPGVYRRYLLQTLNNATEEDFGKEQLFDADEVWLTNAVYGAQRVTPAPESD